MHRFASASARPIVCGHRGAPVVAPENTLESFRQAGERGATWIEFDVRPTGDSLLAVHHDPSTSRGIKVGSAAYDDLDPSIPTFGALVAAVPQLGLDIEMKTDGIGMSLAEFADLVIAEIDEHCDGVDNLIVTSFDDRALVLVRERRPDIPTGLLFWDRMPSEVIAVAADAGHVGVGPHIPLLDEAMVDEARSADLGIFTWTVNAAEDVARAAALGVDMIIGDDPAVIVSNLG